MAGCNVNIKVLENEEIRNKVSSYISEEVLISADSDNDIEIVQENLNDNSQTNKRKRKKKLQFQQPKKVNGESIYVELVNKSHANVCGIQVSIKSLLQNEEIRQQIAQYIVEEVISTNDSDTEECEKEKKKDLSAAIGNIQNIQIKKPVIKENIEIGKPVPVPLIEEVMVPGLPQFSDTEEDEILLPVNFDQSLPIAKVAHEVIEDEHVCEQINNNVNLGNNSIKIVQTSSFIQGVENVNLNNPSDDEVIINKIVHLSKKAAKKLRKKNKVRVSYSVNNQVIEQVSDEILTLANSPIHQETESLDSKPESDNNVPLLESDDWYYLSIATNLKSPTIENDVLKDNAEIEQVMKNNIEAENTENDKDNEETRQTRKVNTKLRKSHIFGKRRKRANMKNKTKIKFEEKVVKRSVQNLATNVQNVNGETYLSSKGSSIVTSTAKDIIENIAYDSEELDIVKEEDMLYDYLDTLEFSKISAIIGVPYNDKSNDNGDEHSELNGIVSQSVVKNEISEFDKTSSNDDTNDVIAFPALKAVSREYIDNTEALKKEQNLAKKTEIAGVCSKCGRIYERYGSLRRHQLLCNQKYYECVLCPYKIKSKQLFQNHVGQHILGSNYSKFKAAIEKKKYFGVREYIKVHCTICSKDRKTIQNVNHCKQCSGPLVFYCRMCNKTFTEYRRVRQHVMFSRKRVWTRDTCCKCGKNGFKSFCTLKKHESMCNIKNTKRNIKCSKIPYIHLIRYEDEVILPKAPPHMFQAHCSKCEITDIAFKDEDKCKKCKSTLSYKCQMCNEQFATYKSLYAHVLPTHKLEVHQCNKCGIVFGQLYLLNRHTKLCLVENHFNCDITNNRTIHKINKYSNDGNVPPRNLAEIIKNIKQSIVNKRKSEKNVVRRKKNN